MKKERLVLILIIVLIFILPSLEAQSGCFLDDSFYCEDMDLEQAQTFCIDDCDIQTDFKQVSCATLPQCDQILCKDTCEQEYRGKCTKGELAPQKQQAWCTPGCCIFQSSLESMCETTPTKSACITKAQTQNALSFHFSQLNCQAQCAQQNPLHELTLTPTPQKETSFTTKVVTRKDSSIATPTQKPQNTSKQSPFILTQTPPTKPSPPSFLTIFIWILVVLSIAAIITTIYFFSKNKTLNVPAPPTSSQKHATSNNSSSFLAMFLPKKSKKSTKNHHKKVHQRQSFFTQHNLHPTKKIQTPTSPHMKRLQELHTQKTTTQKAQSATKILQNKIEKSSPNINPLPPKPKKVNPIEQMRKLIDKKQQ